MFERHGLGSLASGLGGRAVSGQGRRSRAIFSLDFCLESMLRAIFVLALRVSLTDIVMASIYVLDSAGGVDGLEAKSRLPRLWCRSQGKPRQCCACEAICVHYAIQTWTSVGSMPRNRQPSESTFLGATARQPYEDVLCC